MAWTRARHGQRLQPEYVLPLYEPPDQTCGHMFQLDDMSGAVGLSNGSGDMECTDEDGDEFAMGNEGARC